jgi:hypothetical protein
MMVSQEDIGSKRCQKHEWQQRKGVLLVSGQQKQQDREAGRKGANSTQHCDLRNQQRRQFGSGHDN